MGLYIMQFLGPLVVVFLAAFLAFHFGLKRWRHEKIEGQKIALAEEVLSTFYEIKDLFHYARDPFGRHGEGSTRDKEEGENEDLASQRDSYYTCIERLNKNSEPLSKIRSLRYRFGSYFGSDAMEPFNLVVQAKNRMMWAVAKLIHSSGNKGRYSNKLLDKWETEIGWDTNDEDEIGHNIDLAVSQIEEICKPLLRGNQGTLFWKARHRILPWK